MSDLQMKAVATNADNHPFDEIEPKKEPRKLKYISPSGISKFRKDPETFYLRYTATHAPGEESQTQAMSIGSSFDAYAKSYITEKLFGKGHDPKYEFQTIFEAQVSPQWRDWARLHGLYVFEKYQKCGALADLLLDLQQAVNVPKFEIDVTGVISNQREGKTIMHGGVTFLGKPDVFYINKHGAHVIVDWKVNGYLSKSAWSPMPGYVSLRGDSKKTGHHKDCRLTMHHGTLINGAASLHDYNVDWATQLSVYAWLCGCEVGEDFIAGIDQICCGPTGTEFPDLRFATHRMKISPTFQRETFELSAEIWNRSHSGHFFTEYSQEESQNRCKLLDEQSQRLLEMPEEFLAMTASNKRW
jgi:hypothetical protein